MVNIRCYKCGAKSSGDTIEQARSIMNHAVGLSRGIKCGDNYNCIEEIVSTIKDTVVETLTEKPEIASTSPPKDYVIKTDEGSYKNVEGKTEHVTFDEAKSSKKKFK